MDWETLSLLVDDEEPRVRGSALAGFISAHDQYRRDEALDLLLSSSRAEVLGSVIQIIRAVHAKNLQSRTLDAAQSRVVRHAIRKGLSHEDEGVREESFFLLAMAREHFPEEAHAHAEELEEFIASNLALPPPLQKSPRVDEEKELHGRALQRDPVILIDLFQSFASRIESFLRHDLKCDAETAHDAVLDVFHSYLVRPDRYDPAKGRLVSYLTRGARHRVLEQLRSRSSSVRREEDFASVVELGRPSPKDILEDFVEASRVVDRLANWLNERDLASLRLLLSGEYSTAKLAQALGLDASSPEEMRREVKRQRDRLMKILERLGQEGRDDPA